MTQQIEPTGEQSQLIGHGGCFDYTIAEAAIQQGCPPDTISSDVHVFSANSPARVIGRIPKHGTLQLDAPADLSILEIVEGAVSFVDTRNNKCDGKVYLKPVGTVVAGVAGGRPYRSFTVR